MKQSFSSQFPARCQCGANFLRDECLEFIQPDGFAVDFYSAPTTDVSLQHYVPVQEPWVCANGELTQDWFGSYRTDTQGSIFYHSSGEYGHGYALCWRCGRAESMGEGNGIFSKPHQKLRGSPAGKSEKHCEGNESDFSIKRDLHLGYVDNTDVLELYLKHSDQKSYLHHDNETDKQIAWTLAVVLQQALADSLGIASDELGFIVKPTKLADYSDSIAAIVIYDVCSGGGGFACSAPRYFVEMFDKARGYLNCSCAGVCQNCLLGFDTRFCLDYLNRLAAVQFLQGVRVQSTDENEFFGD